MTEEEAERVQLLAYIAKIKWSELSTEMLETVVLVVAPTTATEGKSNKFQGETDE